MRKTFLVLLTAAFASGCSTQFSGNFEFRNRSETELFVSVSGFERNPPVGLLYPNGTAGSSIGPMSLPTKATIFWSETHDVIIKTEHGSSFSRDVLNQPHLICFSPATNGQSIATMADKHRYTSTFSILSISNWSPKAEIVFEYESNHTWKVFCEHL
jgi:hypothetical protein